MRPLLWGSAPGHLEPRGALSFQVAPEEVGRSCCGCCWLRWAGSGALPALTGVTRQADTVRSPPREPPTCNPCAPLVGMFLPRADSGEQRWWVSGPLQQPSRTPAPLPPCPPFAPTPSPQAVLLQAWNAAQPLTCPSLFRAKGASTPHPPTQGRGSPRTIHT